MYELIKEYTVILTVFIFNRKRDILFSYFLLFFRSFILFLFYYCQSRLINIPL